MTTPPTKPPKAATSAQAPVPTKPAVPTTKATLTPKPPTKPTRTVKTFSVKPWVDTGQGQKMVGYGPSGIGKTSLAASAPNPIFVGLDDGGRKIRHPLTGEPVQAIEGVETFADLRDVIRQPGLFPVGSTFVLDTITKAEVLGELFTFDTVKGPSGTCKSIEDYGFGKGYRFLTETMRLLLTDLDSLVRNGVNILLLAQQGQATVANLEGIDYLQDGPKLYHNKTGTGVRSEFCEWADHVFRIGHSAVSVQRANTQATKGKVSGSTERSIFTTPELYFLAKSRPVDGYHIPAVISFESPADTSLWKFMFEGARAE